MWQEFFTAIALVLVIEGILPFFEPRPIPQDPRNGRAD
jgi:uncharacterized protein YjeT (DUF2065 family)